MGLFTQGWYDRIESLLALALGGRSGAVLVQAVLANHHSKTGGDITGAGTPTALWIDDAPITTTPGAPGHFDVAAGATVVVSAVDQQIQYQVLRDGQPVGPEMTAYGVSNGTSIFAWCSLAFVDGAAGPGAHTYALQIFNDGVGTHNIVGLATVGSPSGSSAYLKISETL